MTDAHLWAFIALLALGIAAAVVVFAFKAVLPLTNALAALVRLNKYEDDKIAGVLARLTEKRRAAMPQTPQQKQPAERAVANSFEEIFRGGTEPLEEQPEPEMETMQV